MYMHVSACMLVSMVVHMSCMCIHVYNLFYFLGERVHRRFNLHVHCLCIVLESYISSSSAVRTKEVIYNAAVLVCTS